MLYAEFRTVESWFSYWQQAGIAPILPIRRICDHLLQNPVKPLSPEQREPVATIRYNTKSIEWYWLYAINEFRKHHVSDAPEGEPYHKHHLRELEPVPSDSLREFQRWFDSWVHSGRAAHTPIRGFSQLFLEGYFGDLEQEQQEAFEHIFCFASRVL